MKISGIHHGHPVRDCARAQEHGWAPSRGTEPAFQRAHAPPSRRDTAYPRDTSPGKVHVSQRCMGPSSQQCTAVVQAPSRGRALV